MTIAFLAEAHATYAATGGGTTLTPSTPAGVQDGDVLATLAGGMQLFL